MKKIKVLQVLAGMTYGGTEAFVMNHFRRINKEIYQYDFWLFDKSICDFEKEILSLGTGETRILGGRQPQMRKMREFVDELCDFMRKQQYDVVHSHVNLANSLVLLAAKRAGVPIRVSHAHDSKPQGVKKRTYWIANLFRRKLLQKNGNVFLACSRDAGNYVYGERFYEKYGQFMPNGIDTDKFLYAAADEDLKRKYDIPEKAFLIGNITRFEEKKNQLFLIRTFKELLQMDEDVILILGGTDGGQLEKARKLVNELEIQKSVRFIGVTREITKWLKLLDICVFPSIYEGYPVALLENQASGLFNLVSSNVSVDTDLSLGLMEYADLQEGEKQWARYILNYKKQKKDKVSDKDIKSAFIKKGFDIRESVIKLERIYSAGRKEQCPGIPGHTRKSI